MIYFDMDGVLADFGDGVRNLCKMEFNPQERDNKDLIRAKIAAIDGFYRKLKPIDKGMQLFRETVKIGQCEILTGIPKPDKGIKNAVENKTEWVRKYLGQIPVNAVIRRDKVNFCHGKRDVLIDDYWKNITEWTEMGGTGILFTPESDIEEILKTIKEVI